MATRVTRRNLQTAQGFAGEKSVDANGWPEPLTDSGPPIKLVVTMGQSGSQKDFQALSTSSKGELSLPEGENRSTKPKNSAF